MTKMTNSEPGYKPAQVFKQAVEIIFFVPGALAMINICHLSKKTDANIKPHVSGYL